MARRHKGRQLDGVFLLDKPQGLSSNAVLQHVKCLYGAAKAGHTGALDPLATGMLPLTFGEATKFSQFLLEADKRYLTTAKLGVRTDSSDADGKILEEKIIGEHVSQDLIGELLIKHFSGAIEQVPSMFSALQYKGQPLYKLGRKGETVEVKPRTVTVYNIQLIDFRPELGEVDLDIRCSKGTYIRSIVEDLGLLLGCGAHVKVLRRLESGAYTADMMISLDQLDDIIGKTVLNTDLPAADDSQKYRAIDTLLIPSYSPVEHLPKVMLNEQQKVDLFQGKKVQLQENIGTLVRLHLLDDQQFVGIGEIDQAMVLTSKRLLNTSG
jgi:tRNA pseudouridine55 synthase